jgi:hypothetical protein
MNRQPPCFEEGQEYAGSISTGSAFTTGNFYPGGFNATTTGTGVSGPLFRGRAQVLAIALHGAEHLEFLCAKAEAGRGGWQLT